MTDENNIIEENLDAEEIGAEDAVSSADEREEAAEESAAITVTQQPVDKAMLRKIVEGAILATAQPMTIARILELFDEEVAPAKDEVLAALQDIQADSAERGFELKEVASGWRFQVREETAPWVNRLWEEKPQKYSRALLETLAGLGKSRWASRCSGAPITLRNDSPIFRLFQFKKSGRFTIAQ